MKATWRYDGHHALAHLLWGYAAGMLIMSVLAPAIGAVRGHRGDFFEHSTATDQRLADEQIRVVRKRVTPQNDVKPLPPSSALMVGVMGTLLASLTGLFLAGMDTKLILGLLALVAGYFLAIGGKETPPTAGTTVVILGLYAGAHAIALALHAHGVSANDGGFSECGSTGLPTGFPPAAARARFSSTAPMAASPAGAGVPPGMATGTAVAQSTSDQQTLRQQMQDWRRRTPTHRGVTSSPATPTTRSAQPGWWDKTKEFTGNVLTNYGEDLTSGKQLDRLMIPVNAVSDEVHNLAQPGVMTGLWNSIQDDFNSGEMDKRLINVGQGMEEGFGKAGAAFIDFMGKLPGETAYAVDYYANTPIADIKRDWPEAFGTMTDMQIAEVKSGVQELNDALNSGDTAKASHIMGSWAGNGEFQVVLAGMTQVGIQQAGNAYTALSGTGAAAPLIDGMADASKFVGSEVPPVYIRPEIPPLEPPVVPVEPPVPPAIERPPIEPPAPPMEPPPPPPMEPPPPPSRGAALAARRQLSARARQRAPRRPRRWSHRLRR